MQNPTPTSLSVGETVVVRRGRPWMGVALVGGLLGAVAVLVVALVIVARPHDARDAKSTATRAFALLASAESGKRNACAELAPYVDATGARARCRALVGDDRGSRLSDLRATSVHISAERGIVHVTGSVVDDRGTRAVAADLDVTEIGDSWRVVWDGSSVLGR